MPLDCATKEHGTRHSRGGNRNPFGPKLFGAIRAPKKMKSSVQRLRDVIRIWRNLRFVRISILLVIMFIIRQYRGLIVTKFFRGVLVSFVTKFVEILHYKRVNLFIMHDGVTNRFVSSLGNLSAIDMYMFSLFSYRRQELNFISCSNLCIGHFSTIIQCNRCHPAKKCLSFALKNYGKIGSLSTTCLGRNMMLPFQIKNRKHTW